MKNSIIFPYNIPDKKGDPCRFLSKENPWTLRVLMNCKKGWVFIIGNTEGTKLNKWQINSIYVKIIYFYARIRKYNVGGA